MTESLKEKVKLKSWKWDKKLITGNAAVDLQHSMLFEIINNLINACNQDEVSLEKIEEVLAELIRYVAYHFTEEENIMKNCNYPGLQSHRDEHYEFETTVLGYALRFKNNEDIGYELLGYMNKWLVKHILITDMEAMKSCN